MTTPFNFALTCNNQRKQRKQFFYHEAGASSRFTVVSPYIKDSSGNLIYTPTELDMRRKAEILKYQNSSNNFSGKKKWSYLASSKSTDSQTSASSRICPEDSRLTSTTSSDVPGKPMMLYYDESIPLYNYKTLETITFQDIAYDDYKRLYDVFPITNIISPNGVANTMTNIIILNPNNNFFAFGFTIPVSITYNATYKSNVSTNALDYAQVFIHGAKLDVYYSDSLVASKSAPYNATPILSTNLIVSTVNTSISLEDSVSGEINIRQYVGAIYIPPIKLQTVTQYVYTCKITTTMGYSEYTIDYTTGDAYRSNVNGGDITNTYPVDATSLLDVKYGTIVNIDDIYTTTNTALQNDISNCSIELYQVELDASGNPVVDLLGKPVFELVSPQNISYIPFDISAVAID